MKHWGLGEQWCRIFIEQGMLSDLADLYSLTKDQLLELDRMGDKLATRILSNIEASKQTPLACLLYGIGIEHVGSEIAELLTREYNGIDEIAAATEEELSQIAGIGPKIAKSIASYFQVNANQEVIAKLSDAGVNMKRVLHHVKSENQPLVGYTFVITGTLAGFSRSEVQSRIKTLGGKITSTVSKNTDYLIAGEAPGSKLPQAERLGTQVLDEENFIQFLNSLLLVPEESDGTARPGS